jgi:hypothetical protein
VAAEALTGTSWLRDRLYTEAERAAVGASYSEEQQRRLAEKNRQFGDWLGPRLTSSLQRSSGMSQPRSGNTPRRVSRERRPGGRSRASRGSPSSDPSEPEPPLGGPRRLSRSAA